MAIESVTYEIKEMAVPDGGIALELVVEGSTMARASASKNILDDLEKVLGIGRAQVGLELRRSLRDVLKTSLQFVEIADVAEDSSRPLRFTGRFTYRFRDEISTGLVWYDVTTSATGPEDAPAVVRNRMRYEVHRRLTEDGTAARALVDLHSGR